MRDNPTIRDQRGWAWVTGLVPLAWFMRLESRLPADWPPIQSTAGKRKYAEFEKLMYAFARDTLHDIAIQARLDIKVPKTLAAFRRHGAAYSRIESELYRQLLPYDIAIAETLPFAMRIGISSFDETASGLQDQGARDTHLAHLADSAARAELEFAPFEKHLLAYISKEKSATEMISAASEHIFGCVIGSKSRVWSTFVDSVVLRPGFAGLGIDLKKMLGL